MRYPIPTWIWVKIRSCQSRPYNSFKLAQACIMIFELVILAQANNFVVCDVKLRVTSRKEHFQCFVLC